jgi:phosphohistidine phosphatase
MKTLFLLRHAKSSWKEVDVADFDRPLNERGGRAAPFMGRLLRERGFTPDIIVSSPARRARKTARLFKGAGEYTAPLVFDERIYEASPTTLLYIAAEADDSKGSIMLVGHNPGMEEAARVLTGQTEPMPTAAIAVIDLDIDSWKDIAAGRGSLRAIFRPGDEMDK